MTTAMPDTNYAAIGTTSPASGNWVFAITDTSGGYGATARTTTTFNLSTLNRDGSAWDDGVRIQAAVFSS